MQAEPTLLSCEHCGETFQRREHRDRHVLRHTGLKPFQCHVCSKSFSRNDTLQRHRTLHRDRQDGPRSPGRRATQACITCARLKQRCDGKLPCARCSLRSATCHYDPTRSSETSKGAAGPDNNQDGRSRDDASQGTASQNYLTQDDASLQLRPQTTEAGNDGAMLMEARTGPGQWMDHRVVNSDLSNITAVPPDLVSTSTLGGTNDWRQGSAFVGAEAFHGHNSELMHMIDDPWVPSNSMAINFSLPWTLDGIGDAMDHSGFLGSRYHIQLNGQASAFTPSASLDGTPPSLAGVSHSQDLAEQSSRNHSNARNLHSTQPRPCKAFPELQDTSLESAGVEMYGHIPPLPASASEGLHTFYRVQRGDAGAPLIHDRILHSFVELYFEHFDSQFPFLHPSRLEAREVPWILLLAVAAVGSHYSEMPDAPRYHLTLVDLTSRAVELRVSQEILGTDIVVVQCVFLLHLLWMFSGSHREKVILQHKRSMLVTLCWDLLSKADLQRKANMENPDVEEEWQAWLTGEEELRLLTCVRFIECLGSLFLDIPTIFKLRDVSRQFPSPEHVWQCKDAQRWKSAYQSLPAYQAERKQSCTRDDWPRAILESETFISKAALLELFIDERTVARQLCSSRLLRSSVSALLETPNSGISQTRVPSDLTGLESLKSDNTLLDTSVDLLSYAALEGSVSVPHGRTETIFHVLAILRRVPLEILHTATGWKTNTETMLKYKMKFKDFCRQHQKQARRCLWHATCIFKHTRNSRKLACYDVFSIMVSTSYIYCYSAFYMSEAKSSHMTHQGGASANGTVPTVVRLDQLKDRLSVERWIEKVDEYHLIHLTGVGLLDGSDDCVRFLRDIERTLESQIAWRPFCCAFAASFAQLRRGEMPTPLQSKNDEEGSS